MIDRTAKALELFMQDIVESAAEQTRKTGGKRVAPYHLYVRLCAHSRKRAALTTETFDFLKDIVEKVPDPLEAGHSRGTKRRKVAKSPSDEDDAAATEADHDDGTADPSGAEAHGEDADRDENGAEDEHDAKPERV